ncbi:hypothetical protein PybrP1_009119 [[Pythium] brassicae (nom. inval.)]|nr:hypothetical protein PybrP1_009119 [[Pythium] brassicae (nom. inval.)]
MRAAGGDTRSRADRRRNPFFGANEALLTGFWLVDIAFNASIEFGGEHASSANQNTILSMVQVLLQICALVNFFALLGATFLFRSGLFSLLFAEFRSVVLVHPAYILLTVFLGVARVNSLTDGAQLGEIWDVSGYPVFSCIQKLAAVAYYACSVRAVEKLRRPQFYSHEHWMQ